MKAFAEKKMLKNNRLFVFQSVENSVVKGRNACVEKGFNVQYSVIRVNLTLNGIVTTTTLKIDSRN